MADSMDWLSRLLEMVPVSGRVDYRCLLGAPWRLDFESAQPGEIPYHIVLDGSVTLDRPGAKRKQQLVAGDILILPHGSAHRLHDGSGASPGPLRRHPTPAVTITENSGAGERLDMMCGRFIVSPTHEALLRGYLPGVLVVSAGHGEDTGTGRQLSGLVHLMRSESAAENLGGRAMLNAHSTAMFAMILRLASEAAEPPLGLLALAARPRLAPALSALFNQPSRAWSLPELAQLCNMSRATFVRHFQESMGRSAADMLTDIRMTLAANEMRRSQASTAAIAESVGYQSEAAFQRAFKQHMGMTPAQWRRQAPSPMPGGRGPGGRAADAA